MDERIKRHMILFEKTKLTFAFSLNLITTFFSPLNARILVRSIFPYSLKRKYLNERSS